MSCDALSVGRWGPGEELAWEVGRPTLLQGPKRAESGGAIPVLQLITRTQVTGRESISDGSLALVALC